MIDERQRNFVGLPMDFWILMISLIISNMFILGFSPFIPYFLRNIGAEAKDIGMVFAASRIFYVLLVPIGGFIADIIGRKKLLIIGPIITGASYIALSQVSRWEDAILPLAFSMLPTAFTAPPIFAYIADVSSRHSYGRAYGIYFACMNLGAVAGYLSMGMLIATFGYEFSITLIGISTLISGLTRIYLRETIARRPEISISQQLTESYERLRHPHMLLLISARSLYLAFAGVVGSILIPLWAKDLAMISEMELSLIFAIEGAVYTVLAPIGGRMVEGGRWFSLSLIELAIKSIALIILVNSFTMEGILLALLMDSGLAIFFMPSIDSRISASLDKFHRGAVWGIQQSIMTLMTMGVMYLGGLLWDELGPTNTIYIHMSYIVILIGMLYLLTKIDNNSN
ncbi:MAG: MFS transporter [Nitrososphaerota archaeon]